MSDAGPSEAAGPAPHLIEGRECGACNVCCIHLTIDDPELKKVQGYRCPHLTTNEGCGIYPTRPSTCRNFECGWRQLKWVRESLRPDRSGVLVELAGEIAPDGTRRLGVSITLLTRSALKAEGLAETVAAAVNARVPVFLTIPGPPGYTAARAKINEQVEPLIAARDKPGVLAFLQRAQREGRRGDFRPVVLTGETGVDAAGSKLQHD